MEKRASFDHLKPVWNTNTLPGHKFVLCLEYQSCNFFCSHPVEHDLISNAILAAMLKNTFDSLCSFEGVFRMV